MLQYGFEDLESVKKYLGTESLEYDIILIDVDSAQSFEQYNLKTAEQNYFVTNFDNYSLKKGLEIIGKMQQKVNMTKILFSKDMLPEEDDYLNFLSFYYAVEWNQYKAYFPYENGDGSAVIENQKAAKIRFRDLSQEYRSGLYAICGQIVPEVKDSELRKILKKLM